MMSLVAYGSDSEEDIEVDQENDDSEIIKVTPSTSSNFKSESAFALKFEDLPEPQPEGPVVPEEAFPEEGPIPPKKVYDDMEIEQPPGKVDVKSIGGLTARKIGGKMKIAAPSLKDFEDEEEDDGKKKSRIIQPSTKRSGLFSILPEPKMPSLDKPKYNFTKNVEDDEEFVPSSSKVVAEEDTEEHEATPVPTSKPKANPFVPHVVQQTMLGKRPAPTKLDEIKAKYLKQEANVQIVSRNKKKQPIAQDEGSDEESSDFFSFAALNEKIPDDPSLRLPDYVEPSTSTATSEVMSMEESEAGSSQAAYQLPGQSEEDILKYINDGKKNRKEKINFIEVSADALRPDHSEWIKNITAEEAGYNAPPLTGGPGGMSKRKHQITYLAFQAKAQEQALKNQWAQNKHNKRMTQSKYGF